MGLPVGQSLQQKDKKSRKKKGKNSNEKLKDAGHFLRMPKQKENCLKRNENQISKGSTVSSHSQVI